MQVLKMFKDNMLLAYDHGSFDEFRVSFYDNKLRYRSSPNDAQFFTFFVKLAPAETVWRNIVELASQIHKHTGFQDIRLPNLTGSLEEEKVFSALAAAMMAEERKAKTKLGKRVKLLGCHQVLMQGIRPRVAAKWSRGKPWKEIAVECEKWGF
jgi:Family of unknown function (DUF7004)